MAPANRMKKAARKFKRTVKEEKEEENPKESTQVTQSATTMARNNPATWGLKIPGRPPTPSEGYAQQYDRIGPAETQKLWTFDNGTCLTYGPDDLVDEFDPVRHPFCNQIALIDTLIRDNIAVRARHENRSDNATAEEDPFNNFRQRHVNPAYLTSVKLSSGTYLQVPSRFALITNMPSVYLTPNKSDTPGEAHRGLSNDTRFGMSGKPAYNHLSRAGTREDNIHRLTLQAQIQSGASKDQGRGRGGGGRRQQHQHQYNNHHKNLDPRKFQQNQQGFQGNRQDGRGGQPDHQRDRSSYQGTQTSYSANHPKHQPKFQPKYQTVGGMSRGAQKTQGRGRGNGDRGKRKDSIYTHARFQSQVSLACADTPHSEFALPVIDDSVSEYPLQDYEDEGPSMPTPYGGRGKKNSYSNRYDEDQASEVEAGVGNLKVEEDDMAHMRSVQSHQAPNVVAEELETQPQTVHAAPIPTAAPASTLPDQTQVFQGTFPSMVPHFPGHFMAPNQFAAPHHLVTPNQFVAPGQFGAPGHFMALGQFGAPGHFMTPGQFVAPGHFVHPHFMVPQQMVVPHHMSIPNQMPPRLVVTPQHLVHQGSQPVPSQSFDGFPPSLPEFHFNQNNPGQPMAAKEEKRDGGNSFPDMVPEMEMSMQYAEFLEELNRKSRARGDLVLKGDLLVEKLEDGFLLTDSDLSVSSFDYREQERTMSPTMNVGGRRRQRLRGASARPASPVAQEEGYMSAGPQDRSALLSPIKFSRRSSTFRQGGADRNSKEDAGDMSTASSNMGGRRSRYFTGQ